MAIGFESEFVEDEVFVEREDKDYDYRESSSKKEKKHYKQKHQHQHSMNYNTLLSPLYFYSILFSLCVPFTVPVSGQADMESDTKQLDSHITHYHSYMLACLLLSMSACHV